MTATLFLTGTGTGIGKTFVSRGLARALVRRGLSVAAVKPLETGCQPNPEDAHALARASNRPDLANAPGLYRAPLPLSPYAATLAGCSPPPELPQLVRTVHTLVGEADLALVEGAGGLLVPYDETHDCAELATLLEAPLIVIAPDALGTLSHTLAIVECARARALRLAALVLVRHPHTAPDPSRASNARILAERIPGVPLVLFPEATDDDEVLADAAEASGLATLVAGFAEPHPG